jgi:hypothetical protein
LLLATTEAVFLFSIYKKNNMLFLCVYRQHVQSGLGPHTSYMGQLGPGSSYTGPSVRTGWTLAPMLLKKKNSDLPQAAKSSTPLPVAPIRKFPLLESWGILSSPNLPSPHPLARSSCSRRSGADAMPPKRKRRAPPAKSQKQTEPDPQVPPGADAPLEERLIWVSQQESTAPYPPSLSPPHLC